MVEDKQYEGEIVELDFIRNCGFARSPDLKLDVRFLIHRGEHIMYDPERNEIIGCVDKQPETSVEPNKRIVFRVEEVAGRLRAKHWGMKRDYVRACRVAGITPL